MCAVSSARRAVSGHVCSVLSSVGDFAWVVSAYWLCGGAPEAGSVAAGDSGMGGGAGWGKRGVGGILGHAALRGRVYPTLKGGPPQGPGPSDSDVLERLVATFWPS